MAVAGFVLAIIGVGFGLIPLTFFLAWILGGLGLIFALVGLGRSGRVHHDGRRGLAVAGVVLGIGALVLGAVGVVILDDAVTEFSEDMDEAFGPIDPAQGDASTPIAVGQKQVYGDGSSVQVHSYEQPVAPASEFESPSDGMEYGLIDIEFCASETAAIGYNPFGIEVRMADNHQHGPSWSDAREPGVGSGDVRAGTGCLRGFITVEVPARQRPIEILWDYGRREGRWQVQ